MTFMARTLGYLSSGVGATITVGNMGSTNPGNQNTFSWWGWSTLRNNGTAPLPWLYYPDSLTSPSTPGSATPNPFVVNGLTVLGVVSRSIANGSSATTEVYYVYVAGLYTTGISSLTINGTTLTSPVYTQDTTQSTTPNTRFAFTPASTTTTLFGNTVGAQVAINIS